ncbi:MAG TPA: VWA domain-containing protein [Flavitalea sp.]|nr:VWA domain-containing protein [Flavitalea sp.]
MNLPSVSLTIFNEKILISEWFRNIQFAYPQYFFLLALLPLLAWWYTMNYSKQQSSITVSSITGIKTAGSWRTFFRPILFILRLLALALLIMALARPQLRFDEQLVTGEGVDIMLCMDVSGSMLAQDFTPNRLEAMKQIAAEFVESRPTDRIGLVIFAGESFTSCPLTTDRNVLRAQIYSAQSGFMADGTAIGDGLATSVERLKTSRAKSRVVILLTDGENQGGLIDPLTAKEIAKSIGIKVYTIGMGTDGYAPAPMYTPSGTVTLQQQKVNIDEKLLRAIASETGGMYFRARDNSGLKNVYSEIDKLEKSRIEVTALKRYTEKFLPFALAAAVLLLLELVLKYSIFRKFP